MEELKIGKGESYGDNKKGLLSGVSQQTACV
jgi:hypothetical protein